MSEILSNQGHPLALLWRRVSHRVLRWAVNRRRPVTGHDLNILRGSPLKGTGDFGKGSSDGR